METEYYITSAGFVGATSSQHGPFKNLKTAYSVIRDNNWDEWTIYSYEEGEEEPSFITSSGTGE